VECWCDGSGTTRGNPGGWAFVLRALDEQGNVARVLERSGGVLDATNNRMELLAAIMGLRELKRPTAVTVFTDSMYVAGAFLNDWVAKWEAKRYVKVANADLWRELVFEVRRHGARFSHVAGHSGVVLNERCDKLAGLARRGVLAGEIPETDLEIVPAELLPETVVA
jgi:ribonuclease HI